MDRLVELVPEPNLVWAGAVVGLVTLAVLLAVGRSRRQSDALPPRLTREFQRFRVCGRVVANPESERPVVFLTLPVSTAELPTGAHVKLRVAHEDGRLLTRSYTPTRFNAGLCEIMFRVYPHGFMTPSLALLRVGDTVEMMGPTGLERYGSHGPGTFSRSERVWRDISHVGMISGGTGITPMLQIANHVLHDPRDATQLSLVSFTNTVADIMLGETLRALAAASDGRLRLTFVASSATEEELMGNRDVVRGSMRTLSADKLAGLIVTIFFL
jgi:cytochrome-b5 reductase